MEYDFYEPLPAQSSKMKYKSQHNAYRSLFTDRHNPKDGDFRCLHCRQHVVQTPYLSGVQNRNHCPYCLWSKHVDLNRSGDRLAACKGRMRPVGLALKQSRKKYATDLAGELMLIHCCEDCGKLSINRIAADDISERLTEVFRASTAGNNDASLQLDYSEIKPLQQEDAGVVQARLYGLGPGSD
jgi:hypothetical protein